MAQIEYRGNLSAARFPFLASAQGRTIIVPQYDNVYVPVVASRADEDKDRGIPQIFYCHNVMPTAEGFQSIGFSLIVGAAFPFNTNFFNVFTLRSGDGDKALFAHTTDGQNYLNLGGSWFPINAVGGSNAVTVAYVEGRSFVYFETVGCYELDFTTYQLVPVTLTGLSIPDIKGITATQGYLIAYTLSNIAWSSTVDITDFVPSLTTGAGGGAVEGALGQIAAVVPHPLGLIVYTTRNAVAAIYSGNSRYPFNFRPVAGSGGVVSLENIAWGEQLGSHYVYSTSGIQTVNTTGATTILPEVTDFLAGKVFEDFDETTLEFSQVTLNVVMKKRLTVISNRYLVLSYGITMLTHALIYDLVTRRYGKIRLAHVDCFEWQQLIPESIAETPRDSIAFLEPDGMVFLVNFSPNYSLSRGVLILGKFQYIRQRTLQMHSASIENVSEDAVFKLYNLPSLDGKNWTIEEGYLAESNENFRKYNFHSVGINHSQLYIGKFDLKSFVLAFSIHGRAGMA